MATGSAFVVMLAVDRSQQAEDAFAYYVSNLHRAGNRLYLVHVPEGPTTVTEVWKHPNIDVEEWQKLMEREAQETEELSLKYQLKLKDAKIDGVYKTFYGKPGEALCEASKELDTNLIIIGTRGLGTVRRTILGSVSEYLIHHAHCPVIVYRN